jgi:hypothetical protein
MPAEDCEKSAAVAVPAANEPVKVSSHGMPPALTPAQEQLKADATSWGLPHKEIIDVIRRYDVAVARNLLWQGVQMRRQAKGEQLLASA